MLLGVALAAVVTLGASGLEALAVTDGTPVAAAVAIEVIAVVPLGGLVLPVSVSPVPLPERGAAPGRNSSITTITATAALMTIAAARRKSMRLLEPAAVVAPSGVFSLT